MSTNLELILDLHDEFMEFKLAVSPSMTDLHPQEVTATCIRLYSCMVESAARRSICPHMINDDLQVVTRFNQAMEVFFPRVERLMLAHELPNSIDRVSVDMSIPSQTVLRVFIKPIETFENKLIDRIIDDLADGVSYPKHIRNMIEDEYPNAIAIKERG